MNDLGISLIKSFEGLRLTVYADAVGLSTVGYGHRTGLPVGSTITEEQATQLLEADLKKFTAGVKALLKREASDDQFSALVCFAFNLGLATLARSTLLNCFNMGHPEDAASEFMRWDHAGGRVLPGLTERRKAESELFQGNEDAVREILATR